MTVSAQKCWLMNKILDFFPLLLTVTVKKQLNCKVFCVNPSISLLWVKLFNDLKDNTVKSSGLNKNVTTGWQW